MGKPTGFMEYERKTAPARPPLERIGDFREFHPPLDQEERRRQGARCMACGVPFCQSGMTLGGAVSGCPLHNLIPEWNDLIYRGRLEQALGRLRRTSSFPEFTGRVCPALCEAACTCGLHGAPVTVKENELWTIETAWARGLVQPRPPAVRTGKRVAVVGSGPAGLAAADRLNRRGHQVTVLERADRPGGLLMYGIPNMKLEKWVVDRRIDLMTREGVIFRTGVTVGRDLPVRDLKADYDGVVLACGAGRPRDLDAPGREGPGVAFAVDFLTAATRALLDPAGQPNAMDAKGRHVIVIGGGDTGNDCVGTCLRQGCASVVQLEMMPQAPDRRGEDNPWPEWPRIRKTDYGQEEAAARFGADPRRYETTVARFLRDGTGRLTGAETVRLGPDRRPLPGSGEILPCDLALIAAGFLGPEEVLPQALELERTERGWVWTEPDGYTTSQLGIFAAGDMRRGQSLVVWAIAEGRACARAVDRFLMGYTNLD